MAKRIKKDYSKLSKEELIVEIQKLLEEKKYGLVWEDKEENVVKQCQKELPVLEEVKNREIITDIDKPINLLIEGDNYHALSVLNYTHAGKIDVIYIDPPYNTGKKNEWKYNDRWVDKEDTFRHSKWLSFMEKRLRLAKDLLKKDTGVIFISIDDNEVAQLKMLMDSLFGEKNTEIMLWNKIPEEGTAGQGKMKITYRFRVDHEYILVDYKSKEKVNFNRLLRIKPVKLEYKNVDNDPRGSWISCEICKSENKSNPKGKNYYTIITPKGKKIKRQWHFTKDEFMRLDKESRIYWGNGNIIPRLKKFINEPRPITPTSIISNISQTEGNRDLKNLFHKMVFDNPKPVRLIKYLLEISSDKDATILDFFAGTGTTGHAVLELNKEDCGNRKFILCTNDENSICTKICYPRIKKVIKGYVDFKGKKVKGLSGNLKYYKTSFVSKSRVSDDTKYSLVQRSTEMICIKEDTFEKVLDKKYIKIFKNKNQYTALLFHLDYFDDFKKALHKLDKPIHIYVFSLTSDTYNEDFTDLKQKYDLCPIPESILEVYRKVFGE